MRIRRARSILRTDMFKTLPREQTTGVSIVYTNTIADPRIDAHALDQVDAAKFHFGITYSYVVLMDGNVELGRDPLTHNSAGPLATRHCNILIGVVGGCDENGKAISTITSAQRDAVEWLIQALANALSRPLEITDVVEDRSVRDQMLQQGEAEEAEEEALDLADA